MTYQFVPLAFINEVETEFKLTLTRRNQNHKVVDIRAIVAALLFERGCTTAEIARLLGGYERSTVSYWLRIAEDRYRWKDQWALRSWRRILGLIPEDVECKLPWYVSDNPQFIQTQLQEL